MTTPSVLDAAQLGHLRHWDNLSRQLPHDWSLMHGKGAGEDDFGSYRFQLAYMIYGLALAHRHRLPAAPGVFRPVIQRLIDKLAQAGLHCVQWVPEPGRSPLKHAKMLREIQEAGVAVTFVLRPEEVEAACREFDPRRLMLHVECQSEAQARELIENTLRWCG